MIRKNNLEILKEENVDRIANMGGEMWDQLAPVFRYLSISMISEFEIESIKKDLIGMAEEAELQHISLEEKLGIPAKEFCEDLIQSVRRDGGGKSKAGEICMVFLSSVVRTLTFFWVLDNVFFVEPGRINLFSFWFAVILGAIEVGALVALKFAFDRRKRGMIEVGGLVLILICFFYGGIRNSFIVISRGWNLFLGMILIAATVLTYGIQRWYWNRQSQKYEWK